MTTKTKIASKKVLLPAVIGAIVASVITAGIFIGYPGISSVHAVQPFNTNTTAGMASGSNPIPNIVGSINVVQTTKNVIKDNLKVSFSQAADIAVKQITNGTVIGGHLGVVQGYLIYTFFGVNPETRTAYHTIIDAGNGKVLYTSKSTNGSRRFLWETWSDWRSIWTTRTTWISRRIWTRTIRIWIWTMESTRRIYGWRWNLTLGVVIGDSPTITYQVRQ
jgi:hypothetical protein